MSILTIKEKEEIKLLNKKINRFKFDKKICLSLYINFLLDNIFNSNENKYIKIYYNIIYKYIKYITSDKYLENITKHFIKLKIKSIISININLIDKIININFSNDNKYIINYNNKTLKLAHIYYNDTIKMYLNTCKEEPIEFGK